MTEKVRTICVDFDGVIAQYDGYKGFGLFGDPIPGIKTFLIELKKLNWRIIIHTCRAELPLISAYMEQYDLPFDDINRNANGPIGVGLQKPIADIYLDDRAVRFDGSWRHVFKDIENILLQREAPHPLSGRVNSL